MPLGGPEDLGSTIFSVSCTIIPGIFLTGQIFCLKAADYMRTQKCSTYTSGGYQAIFAEEMFFCQGFNPLQGESPPEQSMMLNGNSSLIGVFEGKLIPSIPLLDA